MPTLPTRFWRWKKAAAVLLLQLTPVAWALVHPRLEHINKASIDGHANNRSQAAISTRQDEGIVGDGTPMGLDCLYRCTWATCGAAACALNRRGLISYPTVDAQTHENATSGLHKRVFNREFPKWSPLHIDYYMRTNLGYDRLRADPQFLGVGDYHMLINEWSHEKTVAKERRMPDPNGRAFQIGTNMVHGCTVVALVSNRAVWMAHFWEVSAMNADDEDFRNKVIKWITDEDGEETRDGLGDPVKPWLYNALDDNTRLFIYTPYRHDRRDIPIGEYQWEYRHRVLQLIGAVQQTLGFLPWIGVIPYDRLNYIVRQGFENDVPVYRFYGEGAWMAQHSARGSILFQHDGTGVGQYWRLFAEYNIIRKDAY